MKFESAGASFNALGQFINADGNTIIPGATGSVLADTDFDPSKGWFLPMPGDPLKTSMTFLANGVLFQGLFPFGNPNMIDSFTGIWSRFAVIPDYTTGFSEIQIDFEDYFNAQDQVASGNLWLVGVHCYHIDDAGHTYDNGGALCALGRCRGGLPVLRDFILTNITGGAVVGTNLWDDSADCNITDGADFTVTMRFGPRTLSAGTARSHGFIESYVSGNNGLPVVPEQLNNVAVDSRNDYNPQAHTTGFRICLGVWPGHNSSFASCRLKRYSLIEGRMVYRP